MLKLTGDKSHTSCTIMYILIISINEYFELNRSTLPITFNNKDELVGRKASTSILFLITPGNVSRLHRINSDEVWHFYLGGSMTVVELDDATKSAKLTVLGHDILGGEVVQYVVRAGTWFGSYSNEGSAYSFVGCTVAPGFEFTDFELGSRATLTTQFPLATDVIGKLTIGLP